MSETIDGAAETYSYDLSSHHLAQTQNGATTSYTYDANGNTVSNGMFDFTYGDNNRLAEVKDSTTNTTIASYTYNGRGERVKKDASGITTYYHYDQSGQLIAETDATGTTTVEYVYLDGQPLALINTSGIHYYHTDHLGTPQIITDQSQNTVWKADYSPFGEATITTETIANNLRFPGQYYDEETGLHYNYYRYYDPSLGRYITSDPIGLNGGLNTYAYVYGNPISQIDPQGLACTSVSGRMTCAFPGGPAFTLPSPLGFPDRLGADDNFYHEYSISRDLDGADPECVMRELTNGPTPGDSRPATSEGTINNAEVISGWDNIVTSYSTTAHGSGMPVVVNTAGVGDGSAFGPGYVARFIRDGQVHTVGEGTDPLQSPSVTTPWVQDAANWAVWGVDMERIIEKCKCQNN